MFITNKGRMYKLKCYEIPEGGRTARGANIVNILPLESDEKIAYMIKVRDFDEDHFLVMATRNGLIKRTPLDAYRNVRKNGLIAITLNENDELASARLTDGVSELLLATENGMSIRFDEQQVRPMSRTARGVHGIKLRGDDHVISMAASAPRRICHDGHGKGTGPPDRNFRVSSADARRFRQAEL